jgi:peroxiredoxin Q/BCP
MRIWTIAFIITCSAVISGSAIAEGLDIGDVAPAFDLQGSDGKRHRLSEQRGRAVVLAWFPKAFTGG